MEAVEARIPTESAERYLAQMCRHASAISGGGAGGGHMRMMRHTRHGAARAEHGNLTVAVEQSERVLSAAVKHGLQTRAHAWQLGPANLDSLYRYKPASFDHVDFISDEQIATLSRTDTIATLVPGANFFLGLKQYPPARKLIDGGAAVALATDFNPGTSPTVSMPFVLSLACAQMKMSPEEAIAAATINGAWALRIAERKGSIEPGKDADLAIFGLRDYREIPYWFASDTCSGTILNGEPRLKT